MFLTNLVDQLCNGMTQCQKCIPIRNSLLFFIILARVRVNIISNIKFKVADGYILHERDNFDFSILMFSSMVVYLW